MKSCCILALVLAMGGAALGQGVSADEAAAKMKKRQADRDLVLSDPLVVELQAKLEKSKSDIRALTEQLEALKLENKQIADEFAARLKATVRARAAATQPVDLDAVYPPLNDAGWEKLEKKVVGRSMEEACNILAGGAKPNLSAIPGYGDDYRWLTLRASPNKVFRYTLRIINGRVASLEKEINTLPTLAPMGPQP